MRPALLVAGVELRRRLRDRSAIVLVAVAPLILASILGAAFSGSTDEDLRVDVAVADLDGSTTSGSLVSRVFRSPELTDIVGVREVASAEDARRLAGDDEVAAAIIIPAGFEQSLAQPEPASPVQLLTAPEEIIASDFVRSVVGGWLARVRAGRLAVGSLIALEPDAVADGERRAEVGQRAAASEPVVSLRNAGVEQDINLAAYFGPSMGILFLFLALGMMARSLLTERRDGTLARLQAAPIDLRSVLAGKALAVGVVGIASLCLLWLVTSIVFGASWGSPLPVAMLIVATVVAIGGIAALLAAVARTEAQAEGITSMVTFVLGLLGGNFFPITELPEGFLRVARLTPNGVALQAFSDLSFQRDTVTDIAVPLATLLAIGLLSAAVAGRRLQRGLA